jgi:hypothetical protein
MTAADSPSAISVFRLKLSAPNDASFNFGIRDEYISPKLKTAKIRLRHPKEAATVFLKLL